MNKRNVENNRCTKKKIKASKLKITIIEKRGRKIKIPAIPLWLVAKIASVAIYVVKLTNKKKKKHILFGGKEIAGIISVLRREEPFTLVEVYDKNGSFVEIKTV